MKIPLRRIESASSLKKKSSEEISNLEQRYRILEQNYKKMLYEAQDKAEVFRKQKEALERMRKIVEKDQS